MLANSAYPALILNADYAPVSLAPISTIGWQDAVRALFLDRVVRVADYDKEIRSGSASFRLPSVIALKQYVARNLPAPFTRENLLRRDLYACCYCDTSLDRGTVTFDHVIPKARGSSVCWENIVAACASCNARKGSRTPEEAGMPLLRHPHRPTLLDLDLRSQPIPLETLPSTWRDFIYWRGVLET